MGAFRKMLLLVVLSLLFMSDGLFQHLFRESPQSAGGTKLFATQPLRNNPVPSHAVVWEVGTTLLQEELGYFKSRFGFDMLRHEESEGGSETVLGMQAETGGFLLSFESKYDGVDSVRRGNDLRYLALPRHWYKGPEEDIVTAQGLELVEAPNSWIRLIGSDEAPYISLHVADLAKAVRQIYSSTGTGLPSVTVASFGPDRAVVSIQGADFNVELVQLPAGQALRRGAGSGRLHVITASSPPSPPLLLGEEAVICFSQRNQEQHVSSATTPVHAPAVVSIDWAMRAAKEEAARSAAGAAGAGGGGEEAPQASVKALQPKDWPSVATSGAAAVIEVVAPWCPLCEEFAPRLGLIANAAPLSRLVGFFSLDGANRRFGFQHAADENLASMLGWARVAGFPSIFFLPAGGGSPVAYDGPLSLSPVATWVAQMLEVADVDALLASLDEEEEEAENGRESDEDDEDCDKCEL